MRREWTSESLVDSYRDSSTQPRSSVVSCGGMGGWMGRWDGRMDGKVGGGVSGRVGGG